MAKKSEERKDIHTEDINPENKDIFKTWEDSYTAISKMWGDSYLKLYKHWLGSKGELFEKAVELSKDATPQIVKDIANGGHIGLFMGKKPLLENWPKIARWIKEHSGI